MNWNNTITNQGVGGRRKEILTNSTILLTCLLFGQNFVPSHAVWFNPDARSNSEDLTGRGEKKNKEEKRDIHFSTSNDWVERMRAAVGIEEDTTVSEVDPSGKSFIEEWRENVLKYVLDTKPSRGLVPGLVSATKNIIKGYYAGIQILLAYPFIGWDGNVMKLLPDTFFGIFSGALMVGSGVAAGIYKLLSGLEGAFDNGEKYGMIWDEDQSQWGFFSLDKEIAQLDLLLSQESDNKNENRREPSLRNRSKKNVRDMSYYNLLKVSADATPFEIKRAYYQMAMNVHPDKNPQDTYAAKKFQSLSSAYQILSKEETREAYDIHGTCFKSEDLESEEIDPYVFFATMFGSYLVEPYIGELEIASIVDNLFDLSTFGKLKKTENQNKKKLWQQQKREFNIARNLRERIKKYYDGKTPIEDFQESCQKEAEEMAKGDFGDIFLTAIGDALVSTARVYLGYQSSLFGFKGRSMSMIKKVSSITNNISTAWQFSNAIRLSIGAYIEARKENRLEQHQKSESIDEPCQNGKSNPTIMSLMMQKMEASLPAILELGWKMNVRDISSAVSGSCAKLLAEPSTTEERKRRAEAVQILGGEFIAAAERKAKRNQASQPQKDHDKLIERVESALLAAIMLQDEKDVKQNEPRAAAS